MRVKVVMLTSLQVSCIDDIFKALLEDEEQKLKSLTDHNNQIRLVATVLSAYEVRIMYTYWFTYTTITISTDANVKLNT